MTPSIAFLVTRRMLLIEAILFAGIMGSLALGKLFTGPPQLQATVHCDSQRFRITNNDRFTWTNVDVELNRGLFGRDGYHHRPGNVPPGRTITFLASQFTRDGDHFDIAGERLGEVRITCDMQGGVRALYTHSW